MSLIEDTRQKLMMHKLKHATWQKAGERVVRCALPVGDYARPPKVVVDTKRTIDELAQNITADHKRFKQECVLAREIGTKLVILTENTLGVATVADLCRWVNPRAFDAKMNGSRAPISGERLAKACKTMNERYGVAFEFCEPQSAAERVLEILERYS
jgi:ribosome-associated protein